MVHRAALRLLIIVGMLSGCRVAVPPVPGKGGPTWVELTSPHFAIWTDADPDRARDLVHKMERLRSVMVQTVFRTAPDTARIFVVLLRDDDELGALSPSDDSRPFVAPAQSPLWQPMIALAASSRHSDHAFTIAHELVHAISNSVIRHQPRWLAEGMATYFQSIGLEASGTVEIGTTPAADARPSLLPVATMFQWRKIMPREHEQYGTAWALFMYLIDQHGAALQHYFRLLNGVEVDSVDMPPEQAAEIWAEAFPALRLDAVDRKLTDWLNTGTHREVSVQVPTDPWPTTQRDLGDADVHAVRALLRSIGERHKEQAREDVAAALALEPHNVLARLVGVALDRRPLAVDDARALAAVHGEDWRAWLLLVHALLGARDATAERDAARDKVCTLMAKNPALRVPPKLCSTRVDPLP